MTAEGGDRGVHMCLYEGVDVTGRCWVCLRWMSCVGPQREVREKWGDTW